jgi:hypothetical protein
MWQRYYTRRRAATREFLNAQHGTKDKKELVDGAVRFLAANYRLEKRGRQISSRPQVAPAGVPEILPGSGQNPPPS